MAKPKNCSGWMPCFHSFRLVFFENHDIIVGRWKAGNLLPSGPRDSLLLGYLVKEWAEEGSVRRASFLFHHVPDSPKPYEAQGSCLYLETMTIVKGINYFLSKEPNPNFGNMYDVSMDFGFWYLPTKNSSFSVTLLETSGPWTWLVWSCIFNLGIVHITREY